MKIVRFNEGARSRMGMLEDDRIRLCDGDISEGLRPTSRTIPAAGVQLLYPCLPSKMVAIWRNSIALIRHFNESPTKEVCFVLKPPSSFIGPESAIVLPPGLERVIFEAELGIVVGRRCRNISETEAASAIFGWTAVNEVTALDVVGRDENFAQHTKAKSYDTFGVFGPVIETELDLDKARIRCIQNDEVRQDFTVSDLIRGPYELLSQMSRIMTLEPGDIISCGSSMGVRPMAEGDRITVEITGIGALTNPVVRQA